MKFYLTIVMFTFYVLAVQCRPQSVQVEKQNVVHIKSSRSAQEKRGSEEETRRILQEINRINIAMGYIRPNDYKFPRVASNEGFFYPRQQFRPEFLTKPKTSSEKFKIQRAINPYYAQYYYYPTPYLQVPQNVKPLKFKPKKLFYPMVYAPYNLLPVHNGKFVDNETDKLGKIKVIDNDRSPKAISGSTKSPIAENVKNNKFNSYRNSASFKKDSDEDEDDDDENPESIIEDIVRYYVPEAEVIAEQIVEEEKQESFETSTKFPPLKNDKYLNLELQDSKDDEDEIESRNFPSAPPVNNTRSISFQNSIERIQNLTKTFTFGRGDPVQKKSEEITTTTESVADENKEEEKEEMIDDIEESKSPFGFVWGPKQQLQTFKEGGLIIQRLRVRHGGIAIAGPGGVATAGSGGTAIVGPNGIALTHPRGLAIGGPGARIYAVPESTDLEELALKHKSRSLDDFGVLVARGPAIFYNKEVEKRNFRFEQVDDSVRLPYLGGAKGQVLEIRQRPDGTIFSRILMDETKNDPETEEFLAQKTQENSFESNLKKIQEAASELVRIQEVYKQQGQLTTDQRRLYSQSLEKLGLSAQKLAKIEAGDDNVRLLLEEPLGDRIKGNQTRKKPDNIKFPPFNKIHKKEEECDEGVVGEEGEMLLNSSSTTEVPVAVASLVTSTSSPSTSTTTKKPAVAVIQSTNTATVGNQNDSEDEESSVAEAKPVGLAISGIGGVASSKPVGTAVVGPGGLAVARPVATAIAGIKPSEFSALGLPLPAKIKSLTARHSASLPLKGKYGLVNFGNDDEQTQFLVGPEFLAEARVSDKGIESNDDAESYYNDDKIEVEDSKTTEAPYQRRPTAVEKEKEEFNELDSNKQIESLDPLQFPFGIEYGKHPLFPPAYDNFFNYPSPYFLPPNAYIPAPITNQYLQRRTNNPVLRYPSILTQYSGYSNAALPVSPFRFLYAQ